VPTRRAIWLPLAAVVSNGLLQRLVEWSDNHTVAKSLRRKGSTMERLVTSLGEAL
jgi:hypothetical protein